MSSAVVLALLACVAVQPAVSQALAGIDSQALAGIDACARRIDPHVDIGYERIAARCPQLPKLLEASGVAQWLPAAWQNPGSDLSAANLLALAALARTELTRKAPARALDLPPLHAILAQLQAPAAPRASLWQRLKSWLESVLQPGEAAQQRSWLSDLFDAAGLSHSALELLCMAALGVVVVLAGTIVLQEIRMAVPSGRARRARRHREARGEPVSRWDMRELDAAPLAEKPRVLLEQIATRLVRRGVLPPAGAMTARELAHAARLPPIDRERLLQIATACERVRYSGRPIVLQELQPPLVAGIALLEYLTLSDAPR